MSKTEETSGQEVQPVQEVQPAQKAHKEFVLPSGKKVIMYKGKGYHGRQATVMMDGDSSLYLPALISQLTEIDGQKIVMEDLDELDLPDYMKIQSEFADQNFTLPQGT